MNPKCLKYLFFSCCFLGLTGCYIADDLFLEEPPPARPTIQKSCQTAVQDYIRGKLTTENYTAFGFTDVIVHVPQMLLNLEEMEADREAGFLEGPESDSVIAARKAQLEAAGVQRTAEIEHFFTLKKATGNLEVVEARYLLNDTFAVIDFEPLMLFEIPDYYEMALTYFFYEYTLFKSPDINEARRLSNSFYAFFKTHLDGITNLTERSAFYLNCIKVTESVRASGIFDPNQIAQALIHDAQWSSLDPDLAQKDIAFSPLYEKSTANAVSGYYIFYKFSQTIAGAADTAVLRFDFSPFYELESQTLINPPYDPYFN